MNKPLKTLFAFSVLASAVAFAGPAEDMLAGAGAITEESLIAMCEKANNEPVPNSKKLKYLDPVAYEAMILAYKDAPINPKTYVVGSCPASKAMSKLRRNYRFPTIDSMLDRLMTNPSPAIRATAMSQARQFLFGTSSKSRQIVRPYLDKETDPVAIVGALTAFSNDGAKVPEIGAFIIKQLNNTDPIVRRMAILHSCSSWNLKTPGFVEKIADLLVNEKDITVLKAACGYAGKLKSELIVEAYAKLLASTNDDAIKTEAQKGMAPLWWDYPFFKQGLESAYKLQLKELKALSEKKVPMSYWLAFNTIASKSSNAKNMEKWYALIPWYKAEDVRAIFLAFLNNAENPRMVRSSAAKVLFTHGMSKEDLTALCEKFKTEGQKDANLILNSIKALR